MPSHIITLEMPAHLYRQLVRLIFAGYWVLETEEDDVDPLSEETIDKALKVAYLAGMKREVFHDQETGRYFCTEELANEVLDEVDEFVIDEFWTELTARLSERDLIHKVGEARFDRMSDEERRVALQPLEDYYSSEFQSCGIDRLHVQSVTPTGAEA